MERVNILSGNVEMLKILQENLLELDGYKSRNEELEIEEKKLEKSIQSKEKVMNDEVLSIVKKREEEIKKTFDQQLDKTRDQLKKIRNKKDKLKTAKISERIEIETSELHENIRQIKVDCKNITKKVHMPRIYSSKFCFSLFSPKGLSEIIVLLGFIIITMLLMPCGIYFLLLPEKKVIYLALTFFLMIVVFGGSYVLINNKRKDKFQEELKQIRALMDAHKANRKQINIIKKAITKDKDESSYGLEKFDEELKSLENEMSSIVNQKRDALLAFENSTKLIIAQEIRAGYQDDLEEQKKDYKEATESIKICEDKIKVMSMDIASNYEAYIGKEFTQPEIVGRLISLMEERSISTVSEALAEYKEDKYTVRNS